MVSKKSVRLLNRRRMISTRIKYTVLRNRDNEPCLPVTVQRSVRLRMLQASMSQILYLLGWPDDDWSITNARVSYWSLFAKELERLAENILCVHGHGRFLKATAGTEARLVQPPSGV